MDAQARRARRAERARRARRWRLMGLAAVILALVVAGGAVAALVRRGRDEGASAATTAPGPAASTPAVPATTTAATTAPEPAAPSDGGPSAQEQEAAVATVRQVGVPLYRTPGRAGKVVALTFDDGPGPYSQTTVATLERYGMRATFFLCGKSVVRFPKDPAIEATVAAMGDHTWNHPYLPGLPAAEMTERDHPHPGDRREDLRRAGAGVPLAVRSPHARDRRDRRAPRDDPGAVERRERRLGGRGVAADAHHDRGDPRAGRHRALPREPGPDPEGHQPADPLDEEARAGAR